MGRKALPVNKRLSKYIMIRLTPPERRKIEAAAKKLGKSLSEYGRQCIPELQE